VRASLVVAVEGDRVTRLSVDPPLTAKLADDRTHGPELWLVSSAASVLEGDELRVCVSLAAGSRLRVRSVAAQLVHPCPGGGWASMTIDARVGTGGHLDWAPEPVVVAAGAHYRARAILALAAGATAVWTDELVLGRTGEDPADCTLDTALVADLDGAPLLRDGIVSGPGWRGPAVVGPAVHLGAVHALGFRPDPLPDGWWPLHGLGATVRVRATDVLAGRGAVAARRAEVCRP
jgi:urease accessory protein